MKAKQVYKNYLLASSDIFFELTYMHLALHAEYVLLFYCLFILTWSAISLINIFNA